MPINDPILYYTMDDADISGATITDRGSGGFNGTLVNDPATGVVGRARQAITFAAASSQYITRASLTALNGATKATLSAWINRPSVTVAPVGFGDVNNFRFNILPFSDGRVYFQVENGLNNFPSVAFSGTGWHHFVMVYDGTQAADGAKLVAYIDNVQRTLSFPRSVATSLPASLGSFSVGAEPANSRFANATFDDVRLFNRALSAAEVADLYRFPPRFRRNQLARIGSRSDE